MNEYVSSAEKRNGQMQLRNRAAYDAAMRTMPDGEYTVTFERRKATRSEQQNRYYWGVVLATVAEHTGHGVDELHEYFKQRFNSKRVVLVDPTTGEVKDENTIGLSTAKLNKVTFADYVNHIVQFAHEDLNVTIPPPDPNWNERCWCGSASDPESPDKLCREHRIEAAKASAA